MTATPRAERLIVALDVPTPGEARALVERIGDAARFYKVGLELFSAPGCFELVAWLAARGNQVFADFKLYDIPETVRRAVANLRGCGATFLTVHGHRSVMQAAAQEKGSLKILAVTVLKSYSRGRVQLESSDPARQPKIQFCSTLRRSSRGKRIKSCSSSRAVAAHSPCPSTCAVTRWCCGSAMGRSRRFR